MEESVPNPCGKVWFLPYQDSSKEDTPEIRAALKLMRRTGPDRKGPWEPPAEPPK